MGDKGKQETEELREAGKSWETGEVWKTRRHGRQGSYWRLGDVRDKDK